jgi:DNA-binding beta-propeller fold protein YncE
MNRIRTCGLGAAAVALLVAGAAVTVFEKTTVAQGRGAAPALKVVALWPQPMPDHQVFGSINGIAVDAQDHIWVTHRGADSLEGNEKGMMNNPPTSSVCCKAAPFVVEFDSAGKMLSGFGGPGTAYQWPQMTGGIAVDAKGNVWVTAAGVDPAPAGRGRGAAPAAAPAAGAPARGGQAAPAAPARGRAAAPAGPPPIPDAQVLKFSRTGQFLLQIGTPGKMEGPDSQTTLNRPAAVAVDNAANEVYVADSGNHRIVVFDADKGTYKRSWGGSGDKPTAAGGGAYDPNAAPSRQFRDVTCVEIAKDGMVYVCDRTSDRIQVFSKDGKFVKEAVIAKSTGGGVATIGTTVLSAFGSVWDVALSSDAQQQFLYVADGVNKKVRVLNRSTLAEVGTIGSGGRYPGQFLVVSSVAMDSRGNLYTGETHHGKRIQKFSTTGR